MATFLAARAAYEEGVLGELHLVNEQEELLACAGAYDALDVFAKDDGIAETPVAALLELDCDDVARIRAVREQADGKQLEE